MHLFSGWPPLPEVAIITTFHAILTQAAQPDRVAYWSVAEYVYRALAMESRAQTTQGILSRADEEEHHAEWLETTLTQALRVVNSLGEAAEAWWQIRSELGATRWCLRQREEESACLAHAAGTGGSGAVCAGTNLLPAGFGRAPGLCAGERGHIASPTGTALCRNETEPLAGMSPESSRKQIGMNEIQRAELQAHERGRRHHMATRQAAAEK